MGTGWSEEYRAQCCEAKSEGFAVILEQPDHEEEPREDEAANATDRGFFRRADHTSPLAESLLYRSNVTRNGKTVANCGEILRSPVVSTTSLTVVFIDSRSARQVKTFQRDELGMSFAESTPATISAVQAKSCAEELGVEVGWTVVDVNGHDVAGKSGKEVAHMLAQFAWKLSVDMWETTLRSPITSLRLVFEVRDSAEDRSHIAGHLKTVEFTQSPLGIVFTPERPFLVVRVVQGSVAESLGVQPNWVLVQMGDQDVTQMAWREVAKRIAASARALPVLSVSS